MDQLQRIEQLERQVQQQEVHIAKMKELLKQIMCTPTPEQPTLNNTQHQIDYIRIKGLLSNTQLTDFDRKFLESMKIQASATTKQNTFLNNLYLRYE